MRRTRTARTTSKYGNTKGRSQRLPGYAAWPIGVWLLFAGCSFCGRGGPALLPTEGTVRPMLNQSVNQVLNSSGLLQAYHGRGCAESRNDGTQTVILLNDSLTLPPYVGQASVLLNGWEVSFLNGDHNVKGVAFAIRDIVLQDNANSNKTLKWQVAAVLSDKKFDDPYRMCYTFTAFGWSTVNITAAVDHEDVETTEQMKRVNVEVGDATTALYTFPTFLRSRSRGENTTVAALPRGFGMAFYASSACDEVDHHLIQAAYQMGHGENVIAAEPYFKGYGTFTPGLPALTMRVDPEYLSWRSQFILKDNDLWRSGSFSELVSGIGGADVEMIDPPYHIQPVEDAGVFVSTVGHATMNTEEYVVENVPFEYAIPVLTGWSLNYHGDDQHVLKMGVHIDSWTYSKEPGALSGTLRYTVSSSLRDNDTEESTVRTTKVSILGIRRAAGGGGAKPPGKPPKPTGLEITKDKRMIR